MATPPARPRARRTEHPRPGRRAPEKPRTRSRTVFARCKAGRRALVALPNRPAAPRATPSGPDAFIRAAGPFYSPGNGGPGSPRLTLSVAALNAGPGAGA